jgi:hypothetical protein
MLNMSIDRKRLTVMITSYSCKKGFSKMPFSQKQKSISQAISEIARPFFRITNVSYPHATQYLVNGGRYKSPKIHKELQQNLGPDFPELIFDKEVSDLFKIDCWDETKKTAYEPCLGQGQDERHERLTENDGKCHMQASCSIRGGVCSRTP